VSAVELRPSDLLDPRGFDDGRLLDSLAAGSWPAAAVSVGLSEVASCYLSGRHLLRFLIEEHLLPTLPAASGLVFHQDPTGSPVRLWPYDADGCLVRVRALEVAHAPAVVLGEAELCAGLAAVYPLRSAAQVRLYHALALPWTSHRSALALVAPFCGLDDDVVSLAAEVYACSRPVSGTRDVLEVASGLFEAVSSARSLVA